MARLLLDEVYVAIDSEDAIVTARGLARDVARRMGFSVLDQARIATAVSELARNVIRYATNSRGEMFVRSIQLDSRTGIEIVIRDDGPGIQVWIRQCGRASHPHRDWDLDCQERSD